MDFQCGPIDLELVAQPRQPGDERRLGRGTLDMAHGARELQQAEALTVVEVLEVEAGAGLEGGGLLVDDLLEALGGILDGGEGGRLFVTDFGASRGGAHACRFTRTAKRHPARGRTKSSQHLSNSLQDRAVGRMCCRFRVAAAACPRPVAGRYPPGRSWRVACR